MSSSSLLQAQQPLSSPMPRLLPTNCSPHTQLLGPGVQLWYRIQDTCSEVLKLFSPPSLTIHKTHHLFGLQQQRREREQRKLQEKEQQRRLEDMQALRREEERRQAEREQVLAPVHTQTPASTPALPLLLLPAFLAPRCPVPFAPLPPDSSYLF